MSKSHEFHVVIRNLFAIFFAVLEIAQIFLHLAPERPSDRRSDSHGRGHAVRNIHRHGKQQLFCRVRVVFPCRHGCPKLYDNGPERCPA